MRIISYPIVFINRVTHLIKESRRIKELEKTIIVIRREYDNAVQMNMTHYRNIYNVGLYVLVLEHDIAVLKHDALFAIWEWRKKYIARQFGVLLYEASHDLPNLLGRDFRAALNTLPNADEAITELKSISKGLSQFKNTNHVMLNKLRNYAGAHRDNDAGKQLQVIDEVNLLQMMELAGNFYESIRDLIPFLTRLTMILGDWKVLVKHVPASNENS